MAKHSKVSGYGDTIVIAQRGWIFRGTEVASTRKDYVTLKDFSVVRRWSAQDGANGITGVLADKNDSVIYDRADPGATAEFCELSIVAILRQPSA
jgi:hypothetical protein